MSAQTTGKTGIPGVVKRVKKAVVRPWVGRRVKTCITEVTSVGLANKRERTVEMGIPGNGARGEESCRREGDARVHEGLQQFILQSEQ